MRLSLLKLNGHSRIEMMQLYAQIRRCAQYAVEFYAVKALDALSS